MGEDTSRLTTPVRTPEEATEFALRPRTFVEFVGQESLKDKLRVFVQAARQRGDALDHILLCGPPGLGKTTLAHILAAELGVDLKQTSGPAIEKKGDLAGILTNLGDRDVLFVDEIHRLNPVVEENLYPAMEDFNFDVVIGEGAGARSIKLKLKRFTLIGATTRTGLLTSPLRDRFGIVERLDHYPVDDLARIVRRSAQILRIEVTDEAADEIGRRARGTPRIANRLLRRVRDFAQVEGDGIVDVGVAQSAMDRLDVDRAGLDAMDRKYLLCIIDKFGGGPVGVETLCAALSEERDTLEEVYEPYLLQQGFIQRTPRGRVATARALSHLHRDVPPKDGDLF
ncbi:MAG TPA: Holliday junction branch migration DNA helicase RuvB [Myxococcota bacterium]|jgi:Holliday junction DNA helicase RuvB|nr:Holliday junction branch migration DNA helicase RuvB [Myxococcota bacterium]